MGVAQGCIVGATLGGPDGIIIIGMTVGVAESCIVGATLGGTDGIIKMTVGVAESCIVGARHWEQLMVLKL